jgi:hypothetical protein
MEVDSLGEEVEELIFNSSGRGVQSVRGSHIPEVERNTPSCSKSSMPLALTNAYLVQPIRTSQSCWKMDVSNVAAGGSDSYRMLGMSVRALTGATCQRSGIMGECLVLLTRARL